MLAKVIYLRRDGFSLHIWLFMYIFRVVVFMVQHVSLLGHVVQSQSRTAECMS